MSKVITIHRREFLSDEYNTSRSKKSPINLGVHVVLIRMTKCSTLVSVVDGTVLAR